MARRRPLQEVLRRTRPDLHDAAGAIEAGHVRVDGVVVTNPRSMVLPGAGIVVETGEPLRGTRKLGEALQRFGVEAAGRVALDVGAAAGGFTTALLHAGASRVYAVDAGHGQLTGSLRADARVVNLESTNLADLDSRLVPDAIEVLTVDVSYLSLSSAVAQLTARLRLSAGAELVGLVKPMFELRLPSAPTSGPKVGEAVASARVGIDAAGWTVAGSADSTIGGARGAAEAWVHARFPGA